MPVLGSGAVKLGKQVPTFCREEDESSRLLRSLSTKLHGVTIRNIVMLILELFNPLTILDFKFQLQYYPRRWGGG